MCPNSGTVYEECSAFAKPSSNNSCTFGVELVPFWWGRKGEKERKKEFNLLLS